jgi:predicted acyltransferase
MMMDEKKRLASLDLLRGFDMFLLLMFQPVFVQLLDSWGNPAMNAVEAQFGHTEWHGFTCWDMIMPLFMFMSGITIPFALSKFKSGKEKVGGAFYRKVFRRFFVLFFLGWVVQGNLLAFDPHYFYIFANTLQSIAVGYLVAAILYAHFPMRWQIVWCAVFFLAYIIVFATAGQMNFAQGTNIAEVIDRTVLGRFRNGIVWTNGSWSFDPTYHYTWILSSLNFIVTVMTGCFAGYVLKSTKTQMKKFAVLVIVGVAMIAAGLAMDPFVPIIKRIWTSSMTLLSSGICFLLMAAFYYIVDIKGWKKGISWWRYYGMNALVAYCMFEVVKFTSVSDSLFFGLKQWLGAFYPVVTVAVQASIVFIIVRTMYKKGIFVKA